MARIRDYLGRRRPTKLERVLAMRDDLYHSTRRHLTPGLHDRSCGEVTVAADAALSVVAMTGDPRASRIPRRAG
jgi:hypothetical protein